MSCEELKQAALAVAAAIRDAEVELAEAQYAARCAVVIGDDVALEAALTVSHAARTVCIENMQHWSRIRRSRDCCKGEE